MCGRDQGSCGSFIWYSVRREVEATSMCEHSGGHDQVFQSKVQDSLFGSDKYIYNDQNNASKMHHLNGV